MRLILSLFLLSMISVSVANAEKICLRSFIKKGKIVQTVKKVSSNLKRPKGFAALLDSEVLVGPQGATGATGMTGAAGATGQFTSTLPSGQTLTGAFGQYAIGEDTLYKVSTHSFGVALSAAPIIHLILSGGQVQAGCPGNVSAPAAAPGHLCLYEAGTSLNRSNPGIFNLLNGQASGNRFGFGYVFQSAGNFSNSYGTWAVTAP